MASCTASSFIDEELIHKTLDATRGCDNSQARDVLARARQMAGLDASDVAVLMQVQDPNVLEEMFETARLVKETIYGKRIVLFAPLYVSNICQNECVYCAFRARNTQLKRKALSQAEVAEEVRALVRQGHKRLLLVAGEGYPAEGFDYVLKCIDTIYATKVDHGEIRRVNVNVAPLEVAQFKQLKDRGIGTYQLFQETYHRETYARVHLGGQKRNYDYRVTAFDRAMKAGIDDVGIGVLFGLYDWKFEMLAMMQHIRHLESVLCGPHTISVPRMEPACGSDVASRPPHAVSDEDFHKLVAILRLAVPYTGIIMSTRENAQTRRETLALGVSQISGGSRTNPGGYTADGETNKAEQFQLGDHRSLDEVVADLADMGYVPSFCTACYRMGRTGRDFMDLAKPGLIKQHCHPNALSSFQEYLNDYASPATRAAGEKLIESELRPMTPAELKLANSLLTKVRANQRDVYV